MPAQCQLIRDVVVALLRGRTAAGARVFIEDRRAIKRNQLPAIVVFNLSETSDHEQTAPRELTREMDLSIEAWAAETSTETAANARNALAQQIEDLMHADPQLAGTAADSYLSSTERDVDTDGERPLGLAILSYSVTYRTPAPAAPEGLDDFRTAGVTHQIVGAGSDNAAHDEIVLQEAPSP